MKNTSQTPNFQVDSDSEDEFQNLFEAIKKGNEDAFNEFLRFKNANINSLNKDGNTPLHIAIKKNRKNIIVLLLEKNADLNIRNAKGNTPLHIAIKKNHPDIVDLLLKKGADPNIKNAKDENFSELIEKQCNRNLNSLWGEIKSNLKQAKRAPYDIPIDSGMNKKRDITARGIGYSKKSRTDPSLDKSTSYAASGLKRALHGTIYQSKLLMLFVKRGIEKEYDFRLATEMDAAEKFDDVVFRYQDQGKWICRFLQAKHKLDTEYSRIGLSDLMSETDGDFSLYKYFISFCKIKKNKLFRESDLEDFTIITNTDFDFDINRKYKKDGQERKDSKERYDLIEKWKNFLEFKLLSDSDKILYLGRGEKIIRFKKDSQIISLIEKEIKSVLDKDIKSVNNKISKGEVNIDLQKKLKSLEKILNDDFSENIIDFLEKLTFITNYPGEKDLGLFIRHELGEEFNLINADLVSDSFDKEMLDFLKSYKDQSAEFYSWKDGEFFFREVREKIHTLMISALGKAYPEKLRTYEVVFEENLKALKSFFFGAYQILHLQTQSTLLSAVKVLQTLDSDRFGIDHNDLNKEDQYIFMRLRTLLRKETQELVIKSFSAEKTHNFLVIECQLKTRGEANEADQIYKKLSKALENSRKKIILIAQGEDILADKFKASSRYESTNDENSFKDLTQDSQDRILKKEVYFQGKDLSLNELIDKNLAGEIIDHAILSRLIQEEKIQIGDTKALCSVGYVRDYYIEREFHHQEVKSNVLKNKADSDLFFITGVNKEELAKLGVKEDNVYKWESEKSYENGIILPSSERSPQEIFRNISDKHLSRNIYWLMYKNGKFFYLESNVGISMSKDLIDKSDTKEEVTFHHPDHKEKAVILANDPGAGKSTVLTGIANGMKQKNPALWVLRMNLNDYAKKGNENSLENIDPGWKEVEIIDFLSKMAISGNSDNLRLQRKLFKAALKKSENSDDQRFKKPKIIILFDGFDEISPTYKEKTQILLKFLKEKSDVTQFWVTTRTHEEAYLKKGLDSPAYILSPLTKTEQKEFLNRFWKYGLKFPGATQKAFEKTISHLKEISEKTYIQNLPKEIFEILRKHQQGQSIQDVESLREAIDQLDFSDHAAKLLERWNSSIGDAQESFTNVALNLKMLAEVAFEEKFQLPENSSLFELYDKYIDIKFNIYHTEKTRALAGNVAGDEMVQRDRNNLALYHQELAANLFFPKEQLPSSDKLIEVDPQELARVGIVALKGDPFKFIHRSFAEFFLSKYLIDNLRYEQIQELLLEEVLLKEVYALVRRFFNSQIKISLIKIDLEKVARNSINEVLKNDKAYTVLHRAAQEGHSAIVKFLFDKLKDNKQVLKKVVLKTDDNYKIPLHYAIEKGNAETLKTLLSRTKIHLGAGILKEMALKTDEIGFTSLHWSAKSDHLEILEVLLSFLKDHLSVSDLRKMFITTIHDTYGLTPLHLAAENGQAKIVDILLHWLRDHFKLNLLILLVATDNIRTPSPLQLAAQGGHADTIKVFLDWTSSNHYLLADNLKLLLSADDMYKRTSHPDFDSTYPNSFSDSVNPVNKEPIPITALKEKVSLADNVYKHLPLHLAIDRNDNETLKALLNRAREPLDRYALEDMLLATDDIYLQNPLQLAAERGRTEAFKVLLNCAQKHLDSNTLEDMILASDDVCGHTPLHLAAQGDHTEILKALFDFARKHPDGDIIKKMILATDHVHGLTSLHLPAQKGYNQTVKILLDYAKEHSDTQILKDLLTTKDVCKQTPLHLAAQKDHNQTVKILLEYAKELSDTQTLKDLLTTDDIYKQHPLHLAANRGHNQTVKVLLDYAKEPFDSQTLKYLLTTDDIYKRNSFHLAVLGGNAETFKILLDCANECFDKDILKLLLANGDIYSLNLLHLASWGGHIEIVRYFLDQMQNNLGVDTLKEMLLANDGFYDHNPLHLAAQGGYTEIFKALLDCAQKHIGMETFNLLLAKEDACKRNSLHLAAQGGHIKIVEHFLDRVKKHLGKNNLKKMVLANDYFYARTSLHLATEGGHTQTVKTLLDCVQNNLGVDTFKEIILATNAIYNRNFLHLAAQGGHNEIVEHFLDRAQEHLDKNTLKEMLLATDDFYDHIPLQLAAQGGHTEIFKALLNCAQEHIGMETFNLLLVTKDLCNRTFLHLAAQGGHDEIIKYFLNRAQEHLDVDTLKEMILAVDTFRERTSLHLAGGHAQTVKTLLDFAQKHPDVTILREMILATNDFYKLTPLQLAAEKGHPEIVKALLDSIQKHTDVNILREVILATNAIYKLTPLQLAAEVGCAESVKTLLDCIQKHLNKDVLKQAVLATDDFNKMTPLHLAAKEGHAGTVKILVDCAQKHFDVDTLNKMMLATNLLCKLTPLHLAVDGGHLETAKILSDCLKRQFHQKNLKKMTITPSDPGEQIPCVNLLEPKNKEKSRKQSRMLM